MNNYSITPRFKPDGYVNHLLHSARMVERAAKYAEAKSEVPQPIEDVWNDDKYQPHPCAEHGSMVIYQRPGEWYHQHDGTLCPRESLTE